MTGGGIELFNTKGSIGQRYREGNIENGARLCLLTTVGPNKKGR